MVGHMSFVNIHKESITRQVWLVTTKIDDDSILNDSFVQRNRGMVKDLPPLEWFV